MLLEIMQELIMSKLWILKAQLIHCFYQKEVLMIFTKIYQKKKKGFKYILSKKVTLKKWSNATNTYDIDTIYRNSDPITVTNQRFDLNRTYEILKHRVEFYFKEGSGWIIDKVEDIWINIANYDVVIYHYHQN